MTDAMEIKYSMAELNDLIQRGDTCVTLQRKTRVLYLNPVQFSNIKSGLHDSLNSLLFKYDFFFKAIVLGYRKIKLLTRYGAFCYRSSKVSVQIEADFYLFNPEVGSKLLGVICKRSGHHLSVLVHKAFTVFLPLDENNYETGWDYAIGQDLEFEVASLDLTSGPLPYIKGKLIKEEKESDAREGEGLLVDAEGKGSYGNEWGGSDSGVASSPGRISEDSDDDNERKDLSEGSTKRSTIEEWTYKRPHHRKSNVGFGDELMKVMEKVSEEESRVYSTKSLEKIDPYTAGETSSQEFLSPPSAPKKRKSILKKKIVEPFSESESTNQSIEACNTSGSGVTSSQDSGSEFPSSPPLPKKRKSILKVRKDISCDTEVTSSYSAETSNSSLLSKTEETAMEASSASKSPKKRKSILKKPKESPKHDKAEEVNDKTAASDVDEGFKSPVKSKEAMGILELDDKSKSILRNIVKDISPMKYETESVKSILETLERSESESVTQDSVDSRKTVPKPKKRMSELRSKEIISSSDDEDAKESDSRNVVLETLGRMESKGVEANDGKGGNADSLSEKQADEAKEVMEKSDGTTKKKRKSLSKSKKRTSLLYESLAEKIRETTGGVNEENSGTSEKGSGNVSTPISKKVEQDSSLGSVTSPEVRKKKKTPKKKDCSPAAAPEDLVKQLLQNMAMAIDADDVVKSVNVAEKVTDESSKLTEGKDMKESTSLKANVKVDSPKKTAGKRKSLSSNKEKLTVSVEDMIKRVTETIQSPVPEHGISPLEDLNDPLKAVKPNDNTEVQRRKSLDGASKKKSRKSVSNLTPIFEEHKALDTKEPLKKIDQTSLPAIEETEAESKTPSILDSAESSVTPSKKQRKSVGEKKPKKRKSQVGIDTPEAEKGEVDDQIEKLLMLNKKMLGLNSIDASGDQGDTVSNEEKKSKKRKRESSGQKNSPKKRKALEADNADIPNIAGT